MPRPIELVIDMNALRHNEAKMREAAAGRTLWAVCKANGYGHGLANCLKAFEDADGIAILDIEDAVKARELGWKKRILMIEGFFDAEDLPVLEKADAEVVVRDLRLIELLEQSHIRHIACHLKVNTGMNRLGFRPAEIPAMKERLQKIPCVEYKGIVTHFANGERSYTADGPATVARQMQRLGDLARTEKGVCLAATTGILFHPEVKGDAVRAGIALYGVSPDSTLTSEDLGIIPAQTLRAKLIAIQHLEPGEAVGYGSKWIARRPSRIGVIACGYADGYPRAMPNGSPVYVAGRIAPTTGAVSMDMMEIDLTDIPEAGEGDWVELWGKHNPVNKVAACAGTIGYELICSVMPRVPVRTVG
ncbi:alanine racemase [Mesosutterella sp. AGMB02718]|uniref:Alanine racemase n=1 Tax=Mesosutterella faecium TaxID=2925194 RepID=A0ABT7ILZ3_9BURK|nr:alanine racemase [Mesosutterella sp. AGMB02718]MDL2058386.1 alanine racemase [Mesosutterella sp. AGMB02718]